MYFSVIAAYNACNQNYFINDRNNQSTNIAQQQSTEKCFLLKSSGFGFMKIKHFMLIAE